MSTTSEESIDVPKVVKISGETVSLLSTQQIQLSGQGVFLPDTQVVKTSGEATTKTTVGMFLFSGYGCTNTVEYSGASFTVFEDATVVLEHLGEGSGADYWVRGYALSGVTAYVLGSGIMNSGDTALVTIATPYEWIEVGVENTQTDFSGLVTVLLARR